VEFSSENSSSESTTEEEAHQSDSDKNRKRHLSKTSSSNTKSAKSVLTKDVTAALDRTKVTDRQAVHLLAATAHSLGHDVGDLTVNRSSIQRARSKHRAQAACEVKQRFNPQSPLTVHWDGKLLPDITGRDKVDRLPVIVTGATEVEQLLGVPKLASGTGRAQADAVMSCLNEWNLQSKIKGLCFDTTASNTGHLSGACILIKKALEQKVLHFACRHHILEIVLEKVFTALKITAVSGPDIAIFKRFKDHWSFIDQAVFETAAGKNEIKPFKATTIQFAEKNLEVCQPRDDYREVLELAIIFVGGTPVRRVHF